MQGGTTIDYLSEDEFASLCKRYEDQFRIKRDYGSTAHNVSFTLQRGIFKLEGEYGSLDLVRHDNGKVDVHFERFTARPFVSTLVFVLVFVFFFGINGGSYLTKSLLLYFLFTLPVPVIVVYLSYSVLKTRVNYSLSQVLEERNYTPVAEQAAWRDDPGACPACGYRTGGALTCPGCGLNLR